MPLSRAIESRRGRPALNQNRSVHRRYQLWPSLNPIRSAFGKWQAIMLSVRPAGIMSTQTKRPPEGGLCGDQICSAASISRLPRRLGALRLLCGRRLALHLLLSILGRGCDVASRAVHRIGRRMLTGVCRACAGSLAGVSLCGSGSRGVDSWICHQYRRDRPARRRCLKPLWRSQRE